MEMINCKVNGIAVSVPKGSTILQAARAAGVEIPTLCYMKEINEICIVEATHTRGLVTACVYPVDEGMEISTNTEKVLRARKTTLELILSTHNKKCLSCVRSPNCELQKLCMEYGVDPPLNRTHRRPIWCVTIPNVFSVGAVSRRAVSNMSA